MHRRQERMSRPSVRLSAGLCHRLSPEPLATRESTPKRALSPRGPSSARPPCSPMKTLRSRALLVSKSKIKMPASSEMGASRDTSKGRLSPPIVVTHHYRPHYRECHENKIQVILPPHIMRLHQIKKHQANQKSERQLKRNQNQPETVPKLDHTHTPTGEI